MISVLTPSFNKREYIEAGVMSVCEQSYKDWKLRLVDNSTDEGNKQFMWRTFAKRKFDPRIEFIYKPLDFTRQAGLYPTAVIINQWINSEIDKGEAEYLFYMSDDDMLYPDCFKKLVEFADETKASVVYCGLDHMEEQADGSFISTNTIPAEIDIEIGGGCDCRLDGGQVLIRTSALKEIRDKVDLWYPVSADKHISHHCDGIFLDLINKHYPFRALNETLVVHRKTKKSRFSNVSM